MTNLLRISKVLSHTICLNLATFLLLYALLPSPLAQAIEIRKLEGKPGQKDCSHLLSGRIERGDAQMLQKRFGDFPGDRRRSDFTGLCLNSEGGSFLEGIKLAHYFNDTLIETRVRSGDTCLSACAIAFMGGARGNADYDERSRTMEVGATIGFHAPFLDLPQKLQINRGMVDDAYQVALEASSQLVELSGNNIINRWQPSPLGFIQSKNILPAPILAQLFKVPKDEFYYLDKIEDIILAGVTLDFEDSVDEITPQEAVNICENADFSATLGDRYLTRGYRREVTSKLQKKKIGFIFNENGYVPGFFDGIFSQTCRVKAIDLFGFMPSSFSIDYARLLNDEDLFYESEAKNTAWYEKVVKGFFENSHITNDMLGLKRQNPAFENEDYATVNLQRVPRWYRFEKGTKISALPQRIKKLKKAITDQKYSHPHPHSVISNDPAFEAIANAYLTDEHKLKIMQIAFDTLKESNGNKDGDAGSHTDLIKPDFNGVWSLELGHDEQGTFKPAQLQPLIVQKRGLQYFVGTPTENCISEFALRDFEGGELGVTLRLLALASTDHTACDNLGAITIRSYDHMERKVEIFSKISESKRFDGELRFINQLR